MNACSEHDIKVDGWEMQVQRGNGLTVVVPQEDASLLLSSITVIESVPDKNHSSFPPVASLVAPPFVSSSLASNVDPS